MKVYVVLCTIINGVHDSFYGVFKTLDEAKEEFEVQKQEGVHYAQVLECDLDNHQRGKSTTVLEWSHS